MATHNKSPHVPINAPAQAAKSRHQHGILTPESTPVPDDARLRADKERRERAAGRSGTLQPVPESPSGEASSASQTKPPFDVSSQDDQNSDSDTGANDNEHAPQPSAAQVDAVRHVLSCPPKEYRMILKVGPPGGDTQKDKEDKVNSLRKMGCLLNPNYNKAKGAYKAFMGKCRTT